MPKTDGSITPTIESYDAASRIETLGQWQALIQAHRTSIISHIRDRTEENPDGLVASITAGDQRALDMARENGLISFSGTSDDPDDPDLSGQSDEQDATLSICLLKDDSAVEARNKAEALFESCQTEDPTLETAPIWFDYGVSLAVLADCISQQNTDRFGSDFVPAPRPSTEIRTQENLDDMYQVIAALEERVTDVMFVDTRTEGA